MIRAVDAAILGICTKFSHALQRAIGLTNYFIAKLGLAMSATDVVVEAINYFHPFLHSKTKWWLLVLYTMLLVEFYLRTLFLTKAEEHLWSGSCTKPQELKNLCIWWWRVTWLFWLGLDLSVYTFSHLRGPYWFLEFVCQTWFSGGLVIFYYFVAVDPLPPGKSWLRKWIENFRRQPELATETTR